MFVFVEFKIFWKILRFVFVSRLLVGIIWGDLFGFRAYSGKKLIVSINTSKRSLENLTNLGTVLIWAGFVGPSST